MAVKIAVEPDWWLRHPRRSLLSSNPSLPRSRSKERSDNKTGCVANRNTPFASGALRPNRKSRPDGRLSKWWWEPDSNQRTHTRTDLQSACFSHLHIPPKGGKPRTVGLPLGLPSNFFEISSVHSESFSHIPSDAAWQELAAFIFAHLRRWPKNVFD